MAATKLSKRFQEIRKLIKHGMVLNAVEAFELLKKVSSVKFVESVDVSIRLGIDTRKDQSVRGATLLPKGSGKKVRVAVFANGNNATIATQAGADIVGFEDLAETIKSGKIDFDLLIATPDAMPLVGRLGPVLGPRGLMPNPKVGTVTTDVGVAVKNAKSGQVSYRTDKAGIIHCPIGNVSFATADLKTNLEALIADLKRLKPSAAKGIYLRKIAVSTTMGPSIVIDQSSLEV